MSRRVNSPTSSSRGQRGEVDLAELGVKLGQLVLVLDDLGAEAELLEELDRDAGSSRGGPRSDRAGLVVAEFSGSRRPA